MKATFKSSVVAGSLKARHSFNLGETYNVSKVTEKQVLIDLSSVGKKDKWVSINSVSLSN